MKKLLLLLALCAPVSAQTCIYDYPHPVGVVSYGPSCYVQYGCGGTSFQPTRLGLSLNKSPKIGTQVNWVVKVSGVAATAPQVGDVVLASFDIGFYSPITLPGQPSGCDAFVVFSAYDVFAWPFTACCGGSIQEPWSFAIPNNPGFIGMQLTSQCIVVNPAMQVAMTQAMQITFQP